MENSKNSCKGLDKGGIRNYRGRTEDASLYTEIESGRVIRGNVIQVTSLKVENLSR